LLSGLLQMCIHCFKTAAHCYGCGK